MPERIDRSFVHEAPGSVGYIEALAQLVDRQICDGNHANLCGCQGWPDRCANFPGGYHTRFSVRVEEIVAALAAAGRLLPPDTRTDFEWSVRLAAHGDYAEERSRIFGEHRGMSHERFARERAKNWARRFGEELVTVERREIHTTPWVPAPPPAVPEEGEDR